MSQVLLEPSAQHVFANGLKFSYFEWNPQLRGLEPSLLTVHATGFHARVWDQLISHLPARHIIALEQRGHGRSENAPMHTWADFGADLIAVVRALDLKRAIGIGHSMGANALVQASGAEPARFSRLILCDPLILPPEAYSSAMPPADAIHPAAKRVSHFESPEAMIERFKDRPPYSAFFPPCLRDYCVYGLVPASSGVGFQLACEPSTEASVYLKARVDIGIHAILKSVDLPVLVIRGRVADAGEKPNFSSSPTWPGLAAAFKKGRDLYLPKLSHLLPMQDPQGIATHVRQELLA